jgi:hypothetical protein
VGASDLQKVEVVMANGWIDFAGSIANALWEYIRSPNEESSIGKALMTIGGVALTGGVPLALRELNKRSLSGWYIEHCVHNGRHHHISIMVIRRKGLFQYTMTGDTFDVRTATQYAWWDSEWVKVSDGTMTIAHTGKFKGKKEQTHGRITLHATGPHRDFSHGHGTVSEPGVDIHFTFVKVAEKKLEKQIGKLSFQTQAQRAKILDHLMKEFFDQRPTKD